MIVSRIGNTIIIDGEADTIYKNPFKDTACLTISYPKAKKWHKYLPRFIRVWLFKAPQIVFKNLNFIGNGNNFSDISLTVKPVYYNVDKDS